MAAEELQIEGVRWVSMDELAVKASMYDEAYLKRREILSRWRGKIGLRPLTDLPSGRFYPPITGPYQIVDRLVSRGVLEEKYESADYDRQCYRLAKSLAEKST
jgi:hypothetical protein